MRRLSFRFGPVRCGFWAARATTGTTELPYAGLLSEAERSGTVLHREDIYTSGPPVDGASSEIVDFILRNTGATVLDVGCGAGWYVDAITKAGRRGIGVDLNPAAVARGKALGRQLLVMSADNLAFRDDAFDSVIMIETLEHLPDYQRALAEATRVARSSVVITVPDISAIPPMSKLQVVPWHLLEATHVNFFTPETLRRSVLPYAASCEVTRLESFFDVDGEAIHMHAAAVARLAP